MSVLIQEKTRVQAGCPRELGTPYGKAPQGFVYLHSRISFQEIDSYIHPSYACVFLQVATDTYIDLRYHAGE